MVRFSCMRETPTGSTPVGGTILEIPWRQAAILFDYLGIVTSSGADKMEIIKFIGIVLRRPSAQPVTTSEAYHDSRGPTVIDLDTNARFLKHRINDLHDHLVNAKLDGATHIIWDGR